MPKIIPCLWFHGHAEKAARFYVSIFKRAKILNVSRNGRATSKASGRPEGSVLTVNFQLEGQEFLALNGEPDFPFSPAISLMVSCRSQKKIDELWRKLSANPKAEACGWLQDKFGVSWQILPDFILKVLPKGGDKIERMMESVIRSKKLNIKALKAAIQSGV